MLKKLSLALTVLFAMFAQAPLRADGVDPAAQQVQSFYDTLLASMKGGAQLGINGRYEKLKPAVENVYDLPLMTSLVVGPSWASIPADQQHALVAAFERMTIANYANNFSSFGGEKFTVEPTAPLRGSDKVVTTKLVAGGQSIPFVYRMRQSGGSWKVIDVYLNGFVSQLATKRSDFASTLSTGGAAALVKKMNALSDGLMKG